MWVNCPPFPRQEGGQNLEPEIVFITIATGAPLIHASRVIQALDEVQLDLVTGRAIRREVLPLLFDRSGKLLEGPEPLPGELLQPAGNKLAGPAFAARGPELPELLLAQVGGRHALVCPQPLPEPPAVRQPDEGPVL